MKKRVSLITLILIFIFSLSSSVLAKGDEINSQKYLDPVSVKLSGKTIDSYFQELTPYLIYKDHNYIEIDVQKARNSNVSEEAIQVVSKFFDNQNRIIKVTLDGGSFKDVQLDSDFNELYTDYLTYLAANTFKVRSGCVYGGTLNPDPCPERETLIKSTSLAAAQKFATDSGYHRTAAYAGGGEAENPARDFTKEVSHNGCGKGVFRNQMVVSDNLDGTYKVVRQMNEPNPEIHEYIHPHIAWAVYVYWWHDSYC